MTRAVLITGGNLGDVASHLARARDCIAREMGRVVAESTVRTTEPWGFCAPEPFLNQVLVVETGLTPEELLSRALSIEADLGRVRTSESGYASRTIDIDILFYGDRVIDTPSLTIPHPLIAQRAFVLDPLCEVMPGFRHPTLGKTIRELCEAVHGQKNKP